MPLTADALADKIRAELFEDWVPFVEIEHPDLDPTFPDGIIALTLHNQPVTVDFGTGSREYKAVPFKPSLMSSEPGRPPSARIEFLAFDEGIRAVRLLKTADQETVPLVRLFGALEKDFGMSPCPKQLSTEGITLAISYNAFRIEIPIVPDLLDDESASTWQFTPYNFPALFGFTPS